MRESLFKEGVTGLSYQGQAWHRNCCASDHCPSFRDLAPGPLARVPFSVGVAAVTAPHAEPDDAAIAEILRETRVIAVVGFSANPLRPSHAVAEFLQRVGYRVIPVNPGLAGSRQLGETVWPDLASIPPDARVDMVDIFRQSVAVPGIVDEALATLPQLRTIWMQIGVVHPDAAARARGAGLRVVMNRCPKIEYPRLIGGAARPMAGP